VRCVDEVEAMMAGKGTCHRLRRPKSPSGAPDDADRGKPRGRDRGVFIFSAYRRGAPQLVGFW
jgi:hypothetical protein